MEDFSQLIAKWQEKRKKNVQMIVVEEHDDRLRVVEVTHRGERIKADATEQGI
jgi:hypothetical protein